MATEKYLIQIKVDIANDKQLQALTSQLQKTAKAAPKVSKAFGKASVDTKKFGRIAQNTSFQVQDLIVQIGGGTDVMRALSQQLPQMLVGMGAWGAAVGVVAAALPLMYLAMKDGEVDTRTLMEMTNDLNEAMGNIGATANALDMSNWIEQFQKATKAEEAFLLSTLKLQKAIAKIEADAQAGGLRELTSVGAGLRRGGGSATKEALGIKDIGDFVKVVNAYRELEASQYNSIEALQQVLEIQTEIFEKQGKRNPELEENIKILEARMGYLKGINAELQEIEVVSSRIDPYVAKVAKAQEDKPTSSAAADAAIAANDFKQMQIEAELAGVALEKLYAVTAEGDDAFSLLDESTQIFLNTFDSAVDGVARGTQDMSQAFESMAKSILLQVAKLAAIRGIGTALSGQGGFLGSLGESLLAEKGAVVSGGSHMTAYAKGGVVSGPTIFPMKNGAGLMGEAGAEAVMPLTRMSNGNLGVESSGMNVTVNNNAAGVSVVPRQTDEGLTIDVVMNAVSSAVRRGGNEIASSIEESYALNRGRGVYGS
jgi:hypothetical protein